MTILNTIKVPGLSEKEIEDRANKFRSIIGVVGPILAVNVVEFGIQQILEEFDWLIVDDENLKPDLARTWPDLLLMHISNSVYEKAYDFDANSNFIIAHEIGHLVLHRNVSPSYAFTSVEPQYNSYFNAEKQANKFAASFLMPTQDVRATCTTALDIQRRYWVSIEAAEKRIVEVFGEEREEAITQKKKQTQSKTWETIEGQRQLALDFCKKG